MTEGRQRREGRVRGGCQSVEVRGTMGGKTWQVFGRMMAKRLQCKIVTVLAMANCNCAGNGNCAGKLAVAMQAMQATACTHVSLGFMYIPVHKRSASLPWSASRLLP